MFILDQNILLSQFRGILPSAVLQSQLFPAFSRPPPPPSGKIFQFWFSNSNLETRPPPHPLSFLNWRIIRGVNRATTRHNSIATLKRLNILCLLGQEINGEIYCCRRDRAMTGLLSGVVLVLVLCHSPKTFLNIQVRKINKWTLERMESKYVETDHISIFIALERITPYISWIYCLYFLFKIYVSFI